LLKIQIEMTHTALHFDGLQVFDKEWHKVHFGVHRERVVLYVDCELSEELPLDIRGKIDVNGEIAISKVAGTRRTVPVSDTSITLIM
jgi:collagen type IX alpha